MDDVVAQIEELEEAVAEIVGGAGAPVTRIRLARAYVAAVLSALETWRSDLTPDELEELVEGGGVEGFLRALFERVYGPAGRQLAQDVADRTREAVTLTAALYKERGIDVGLVSEAVARARVTERLTEGFQAGIRQINQELFQATLDALTEATLSGSVSVTALELDVAGRTDVHQTKAVTQAQVAVGAYNQAWRRELAAQAELTHQLYYGTLKANSRHFCRAHLGRVFSDGQIAQMDNGQIDPASLFRGGYRCRHQWLPVDLEWSPELRAKLVDAPPVRVQVDLAGNRFITVIMPADAVPRLEHQIRLQYKAGGGDPRYTVFQDAESNVTGFVAYHDQWLSDRLRAGDSIAAGVFDEQEQEALDLAERGRVVRLTPAGLETSEE